MQSVYVVSVEKYVETGMGGEHPGQASAITVGKPVSFVVVHLIADMQSCEDNLAINIAMDVQMVVACGGAKLKSLAMTTRAEAIAPLVGRESF